MSTKKALLGAVLVLGLATLPASAATFNIEFDLASNGSGVDFIGTFDAPAGGGQLTAVNFPQIDGILYDTIDPSWVPATYNSVLNQLSNVILDQLINLGGTGTAAILFVGNQWATGLYTQACVDERSCPAAIRGTYAVSAVSEVPLPAALPLLAAGLGALGFTGWRKKRKALTA